jgi:hypothetical protein
MRRSDDDNWVWALALVGELRGTRPIRRNRIRVPGGSRPTRAAYKDLIEPGSSVMGRKMLLGIEQQAEDRAAEAQRAPQPPGLVAAAPASQTTTGTLARPADSPAQP